MSVLPPANEVWGKVLFSELCVKNSVHGGGGVPGQVPPGTRYTPGTRHPPRTRYTPWDQVHPPGPGIPPRSSACREIRVTSGQYASYWNAFLLCCWLYTKKSIVKILQWTLFLYSDNCEKL